MTRNELEIQELREKADSDCQQSKAKIAELTIEDEAKKNKLNTYQLEISDLKHNLSESNEKLLVLNGLLQTAEIEGRKATELVGQVRNERDKLKSELNEVRLSLEEKSSELKEVTGKLKMK